MWAKKFKIPMNDGMPANFPVNTLPIMRQLAALRELDGDGRDQHRLTATLDVLYHEFWVNHRATHEPDTLREILIQIIGEDERSRVAEAAQKEGKLALLRNTDEAFAKGGFGLPWMVCTNEKGQTEGFFGVDHLGLVTRFLGLERPNTSGWKSML